MADSTNTQGVEVEPVAWISPANLRALRNYPEESSPVFGSSSGFDSQPLYGPQAAKRIEELEAESRELTKALTGLTCGGSEFFVRRGERYVADIDACVAWVRRRDTDAAKRSIDAIKERQAAEARAIKAERQRDEVVGALEEIARRSEYPSGEKPYALRGRLADIGIIASEALKTIRSVLLSIKEG